jgi:hypothetical protein
MRSPMPRGERIAKPAERGTRLAGFLFGHQRPEHNGASQSGEEVGMCTTIARCRSYQTTVLLPLGVVALLASCSKELPMQSNSARPLFEIQDAAHSNGNRYFFFLSIEFAS